MKNTGRFIVAAFLAASLFSVSYVSSAAKEMSPKLRAEKEKVAFMKSCQADCEKSTKGKEAYEACMVECNKAYTKAQAAKKASGNK